MAVKNRGLHSPAPLFTIQRRRYGSRPTPMVYKAGIQTAQLLLAKIHRHRSLLSATSRGCGGWRKLPGPCGPPASPYSHRQLQPLAVCCSSPHLESLNERSQRTMPSGLNVRESTARLFRAAVTYMHGYECTVAAERTVHTTYPRAKCVHYA